MGKFVKGDVVIIPFPFSDLTGVKRRPAFVVADLPGDDIILCQITSAARSDPLALALANNDFILGSIPVESYIRPNKIFTADKNIILKSIGHLSDKKTDEVIKAIVSIVQY
jgi:mRNA interferase MazF